MDINHVQFILNKQDSETVSLFMLQAHGKLVSQQPRNSVQRLLLHAKLSNIKSIFCVKRLV